MLSYVSEAGSEYCKAVKACVSLDELRAVVKKYRIIADDAFAQVKKMKPTDWKEFRAGIKLEAKQQYAGDTWCEKYGAILLPAIVLHVGMIAAKFHAPFGCAYNQCLNAGVIVEENGIAKLVERGMRRR